MIEWADDDTAFTVQQDVATDDEAQGWIDCETCSDGGLEEEESRTMERYHLAEYETECRRKVKRQRKRDLQDRWSANVMRPGFCVRLHSLTSASPLSVHVHASTTTYENHAGQSLAVNQLPSSSGRMVLSAHDALEPRCLINCSASSPEQCTHASCVLYRSLLIAPPPWILDQPYTVELVQQIGPWKSANILERLFHAAVASGHINTLRLLEQRFSLVHLPDLALTACDFGNAEVLPSLLKHLVVDVRKKPLDEVVVQLFDRASFSGHHRVLQILFAHWPGLVQDDKMATLSCIAQRAMDLSIECNWPLVAEVVAEACSHWVLGFPDSEERKFAHPARFRLLRMLLEPSLMAALHQGRWALARSLIPFCPGCPVHFERRPACLENLVILPEDRRHLMAPLLYAFLMGSHPKNAKGHCPIWKFVRSSLFDRNLLKLIFQFV